MFLSGEISGAAIPLSGLVVMDNHWQGTGRSSERKEANASRPPCRRAGCAQDAVSPGGFCAGCQRAYEHARRQRARVLTHSARLLAESNPQLMAVLVGSPSEQERLLAHAAAHNTDRGRPGHHAIPMAALRDYLAETMEQLHRLS
jgi:hypothetical protein